MTGRTIIIIVVGIILTAAIILFRIEAASTNIVKNVDDYYYHQTARNIAQSGVGMGLRKLADSSSWRAGIPLMNLLTGKVIVTLADTTFNGCPVVRVCAVGITGYGTNTEMRDTSTAFTAKGPGPYLPKAAAITNGATRDGGGLLIDGEDHDTTGTKLVAQNGILGVFTTSTFQITSNNSTVGGTNSIPKDIAPKKNNYDTSIIHQNQTYTGGFPKTPEQVLGGVTNGYTDGMLKIFAQSGQAGSQYVTDPVMLKANAGIVQCSGVTYLELAPGITWSPKLSGSGIVVVHNSSLNATLKQPGGMFKGLIITDDLTNLGGLDLIGSIIQLTSTPTSDIFGTSNGSIIFSRQAIVNALAPIRLSGSNGSAANVIGWWE